MGVIYIKGTDEIEINVDGVITTVCAQELREILQGT